MRSLGTNYRTAASLGPNTYTAVDNPLTYCVSDNHVDQLFMHGSSSDGLDKYSNNCQSYMAGYCADKWDKFCEVLSHDKTISFPSTVQQCGNSCYQCSRFPGLTFGQILIRNTAEEKYLIAVKGCVKYSEPFDPNVATSPLVYWWAPSCNSGKCLMKFAVNPKTVDSDVVMDKLLAEPCIAPDILLNIYSTMKEKGDLKELKGTKLGKYYTKDPYFASLGGLG